MNSHESQADALIELIFSKCSLVYGRDFLSRWEGQDMGEVKADWRRELGAVLAHPQAIRHALENLPADKAPNVLQFRALCINCPGPVFRALPMPAASDADRQRVRDMLTAVRQKLTGAANP